MQTTFKRLVLSEWRQFEKIDIELHPTLTIITGANGAGKSTLLNLFSRHFGWQRNYLATPKKNKISGGYSFFTGWLSRLKNDTPKPSEHVIGTIFYSNGKSGDLNVPKSNQIQYNVTIKNQQNIQGIFIPSHRAAPVYQAVSNIPTTSIKPSQAYSKYKNESVSRYTSGSGGNQTFHLKEALISMAMFGEGNNSIEGDPHLLGFYHGFKKVLKIILPSTLGFVDIAIRIPDVVLVTRSGEFVIDAASGGVTALIDLAWQIHMLSHDYDEFIVVIDEPENHLHPSMQRTLMENLVKAFPSVQFIVATHSPFIISSVKESNVYVLGYRERQDDFETDEYEKDHTERWVYSTKLDTVNRAGNANEILREVLGVEVTTPHWVQGEVEQIISRYREYEFNTEMLTKMRRELSQFGYDDMYPDAVAALVRAHD